MKGKKVDDTDRLLDYAQGRLNAADTAAVDAELADNPDLQAELAVIKAVSKNMQNEKPEETIKQAGWDRLSASIDGARYGTPANDNRGFSLVHLVGAAAASVVVWQFVAAPLLVATPSADFSPASIQHERPVLKVAFAGAARIEDITSLLVQAGATIIDGPSAIKLYTIGFSDDAARAAAEAVFAERSALVQNVARP